MARRGYCDAKKGISAFLMLKSRVLGVWLGDARDVYQNKYIYGMLD
jgi:hypothetical protein